MRILLACPYAWDAPGGVQVHVRELGEELRRRGHDVVALTPSRTRPAQDWVRAMGRPLAIPYNMSAAPICPWPASARRVGGVVRSFGPDVVHVHEPLTPSTSMFAMLASPAPVVATFHSGADRSWLFDLAAPVLRRMARRIRVRIAISERAASFAARRLGNGFRVIPNGVDVERFARAEPAAGLPEGRRILFVGRLDERKGFPTAVRAFEWLADAHPDLMLVAAGDGPDRAAVDRLPVATRGRVVLLGRVPNEDLPPYHAAADVFVASSVGGESFGMVLTEALAAGLPTVASDIPGYREVIRDGIDGLLVPPGDPGALAGAIGRVLDDPELAGRLRKAAPIRAREFSWSAVGDALEAAYREARSR